MATLIDVVLPVFALVAIGWGLARTPVLTVEGLKGLAGFVYWVAIPALLFRTLATTAPPGAGDLGLLATYFIGCIATYAVAMIALRWSFRTAVAEGGVLAMGATFSNSVMLGIPIVERAFGPEGLTPLLLIITVHSAVLIGLASLVVEAGLGQGGRSLALLRSIAIGLVRNPVMISIGLGIAWSAAGLNLPTAIDRTTGLLAAAGSPCALVALGASLAAFRMGGAWGEVLIAGILKLLVLPAAVWLIGRHAIGLAPLPLAVAVTCAALPSGNNAFILAQRYGVAVPTSATLVLITTGVSVMTLSVLLRWLVPG